MLPTNNTAKIELFGKELILSERFARDVNKLIAYSKQKKEKDFTDLLIESAIAIEDGLKLNYLNLKWYRFWQKRQLKKQLSKEYMLANLSSSKIFELAKRVYELEGFIPEDEKKNPILKESESVVQS
jgi:hypothetical protein